MIVYAAFTPSPRREYWVGGSTVKAIVGQMLTPGLLDVYLGRTGYDSQQREEPDSPDRPYNLWRPVSNGFGRRTAHLTNNLAPSVIEAEVSQASGLVRIWTRILGHPAFCARKLLSH